MDISTKNEERKNGLLTKMSVLQTETKVVVHQATERGASSWLNSIPISEQDPDLNKEEFCDALRLRYNFPLSNLPSFCTDTSLILIMHYVVEKADIFEEDMTNSENCSQYC